MLTKEPLELNEEFRFALDLLEKTERNFFITGKAGTGKSTLLQLFRSVSRKRIIVLAPTGIAALNVKGQTIHSFFGFPPKLINKRDIKKRRNRRIYKKIDCIIIDEISMVRADLLDNIDYFLRLNRDIPSPFGSVQMIFFGDLFQLPPIVASVLEKELFTHYYDSPYFFSAKVYSEEFSTEFFELNKVYRQDERRFIRLLDSIRLRQFDVDDIEELNSRYIENHTPGDFQITISTLNAIADNINLAKLRKIDEPVFRYQAKISGVFNPKLFPAEALLQLKKGAQVMFVKNDPEKRFVNGTLGQIVALDFDLVRVAIENPGADPRHIDLEPQSWEIIKYKSDPKSIDTIETEIVGTFEQYPIRLAWGITIHKSQGKTFNQVIIDLGKGAFEYGQTYVALSRCRKLEGIILSKPLRPQDVFVDERVVEFYEQHR